MKRPSAAPLSRTVGCDVCFVGGGIAGLTTTDLLADGGRSVSLFEAGDTVAGGETPTASTAKPLRRAFITDSVGR